MVQALIELDDETNRILNMVKAKHTLRDKSQALGFIVKQFNDNKQLQEVKYLNDGDPWLLAEDVPDIDFFFSQIWLSCFVNEFSKPVKAYKKILGVYDKYHLLFYYGEKDAYSVANTIVERFINEPSFATEVNKQIMNWADKLKAYAEPLPKRDLDKASSSELWNWYEAKDKLHTEYYQWGWMPVAADMFHNNLTETLKGHLREKGLDESKVNEYFIALTQSTKKSLIQVEQEEFLALAAEIQQNKAHRKLFEELYKNFREQDVAKFGYKTHTKEYEEMLEQKSSTLISQIKPELLTKIREHYEKYFYVNHMWVGKVFELEHYLKELVKLMGTHADINETLKDADKEISFALEKRKQLLKELKLDKKWETLFDAFGDFMVTKIYRRFSQIYAVYKMEFIQQEIARRFNLDLMDVRFMLPLEVKRALLEGIIDKETLKERTEFCVYYAEEGKDVIYTGVKARELAERAKKVETQDVNEIKGQVACMGHAKGIVRIIIRPSDMGKMNKGDILVSIATDPDIVPAMKKAAAIVTEQGGVTSHAAIVSRELGIPCVIGTKIATKVLKDG